MKNAQSWTGVAGVAAAITMTAALAGCGGTDEPTLGSTPEAPPTSEAPPEKAEPTGTFTVTGASSLTGTLSDIVCVPSDDGVQVTGAFTAGASGTLTVVSGSAPEGSDRRDSLTLKGDDIELYGRISGPASTTSLPFDIVDDGAKVTGSVVLVDIEDVAKPDLDDQKQVKLAVDVDCGA